MTDRHLELRSAHRHVENGPEPPHATYESDNLAKLLRYLAQHGHEEARPRWTPGAKPGDGAAEIVVETAMVQPTTSGTAYRAWIETETIPATWASVRAYLGIDQ